MSNHNSTLRQFPRGIRRVAIFVTAFALVVFTIIGLRTFLGEGGVDEKVSAGSSSLLTARLTLPKIGHATPETELEYLYGPLAGSMDHLGCLIVTVPKGSNVWAELEHVVLDAQIAASDTRDVDHWDQWKAQTRERIVGNLLVAIRHQEQYDLNVVPAGYTVFLNDCSTDPRPGPSPLRNIN